MSTSLINARQKTKKHVDSKNNMLYERLQAVLPGHMTYKKTKKWDMPPQEIKIALLKRKETQAGIARLCNVSKAAVYRTIQGETTSHRIRSIISEKTGMDLKLIWPSTYLHGGGPRKKGRPPSKRPFQPKYPYRPENAG